MIAVAPSHSFYMSTDRPSSRPSSGSSIDSSTSALNESSGESFAGEMEHRRRIALVRARAAEVLGRTNFTAEELRQFDLAAELLTGDDLFPRQPPSPPAGPTPSNDKP